MIKKKLNLSIPLDDILRSPLLLSDSLSFLRCFPVQKSEHIEGDCADIPSNLTNAIDIKIVMTISFHSLSQTIPSFYHQ